MPVWFAQFTGSNGVAVEAPSTIGANGDLRHSKGDGTETFSSIAALGIEPALGNPAQDGYVLSSTAAGVRSWVPPTSGGASQLDDLSDVTVVTPSIQQVLINDGAGQFTNRALQEADISDFGTYPAQQTDEDTLTGTGTFDLAASRHKRIDLTAAGAAPTITLTPPTNPDAGRIRIKQHATTPVNVVFAAGGGATLETIGSTDLSGDTAGKGRVISWTWDKTDNVIVLLYSSEAD